MKKQILYIGSFIASFLLIVLGSCDKREFVTLEPDHYVNLTVSPNSVVLTDATADDDVLTVNWEEPYFGFDAAPTYDLMIDLAINNFSSPQLVNMGTEIGKVFKGSELNGIMLALGATPDQAIDVSFRVRTKLGTKEFYSEVVTANITPYSSYLDLSTEWGVVGSATPGGWGSPDIPDLPFYRTSNPDIIVAYVYLRNGEIKFRKNNDWTVNVGDNGLDGTLEPNGANIPVTEGDYKITFDIVNMTYTIEDFVWGIVGSATPNGWNGPDIKLEYNPYHDDFRAAVTLINGEIKFRKNNDWTLNYGDDGGDGTLDQNGANIPVTAGHYTVVFNPNTLEYSITATDLWGLVGSATPNGWNGPDLKFHPDYGPNQGKWYLHGAILTNGEIKIRQNDNWAVNYGDDGNDGTLDPNGANKPVTAGTYDIELDFSVTPPIITLKRWVN